MRGTRAGPQREQWRGQGIARHPHETLLKTTKAEQVLLNVHPGGEAAPAAHRARGYRRIGEARPWGTGSALHDVMLLGLR
ncbi:MULTISPECIES: hypothetical protein [unclassified Streptomyces]|uniref:hypothetical protein n=1 Tax=unclassified Streptomyces TaxID=2593676 RepID=UPI000B2E7B14